MPDFDDGIGAPQMAELMAHLGGEDGRIRIDPDRIETDLARVVLGIMAMLRELMELQAIRRMENGSLLPDEEERLGTALLRAEAAIFDMAARFDLRPEDLSLNLGPLGRTI